MYLKTCKGNSISGIQKKGSEENTPTNTSINNLIKKSSCNKVLRYWILLTLYFFISKYQAKLQM